MAAGGLLLGRPVTNRMYEVTRDVPAGEEGNYGPRSFSKGERLYKYVGATYGCIDYDEGLPVSEYGSSQTPFFQFPADALREVTSQ